MGTQQVLPLGFMDTNAALETNFIIREFRKMNPTDRQRLAVAVLDSPLGSEELRIAAKQLFELFWELPVKDRAWYVNNLMYDGEHLLDGFFCLPHAIHPKMVCYVGYFREFLRREGDDFVIDEIVLPHRLVRNV